MLNDEEYLKLIEQYHYSFKQGESVEGEIAGYEAGGLLVDIKSKTLAFCPEYEVLSTQSDIKEMFKIGEKYEFIINSPENEDGVFYLSHRKVALLNNFKILEEKFNNNETVEGTVISLTKGGIMANIMGIRGFCPTSQLKSDDIKVKDILEFKILSIDIQSNNLILSNRKVYNETVENVKKDILDKIEVNIVVKGTVVRLTDFGAFVDIGGMDGLLPLSQISWSWIDSPSDVLKLDDKIDVEIIGIDKEKQRISLSIKSLEENPWLKAQQELEINSKIKGKITRIRPFGVFVEIYPKVEGLLNKAQSKEYSTKYKTELKENDEIELILKDFDIENKKIIFDIP